MTIPRRKPRFYDGQRRDVFRAVLGVGREKDDSIGLFEEKIASYVGRKFAVATCSGRNAMEIILGAFGIKSGDEVIVPAYTLKDLLVMMKEKGIVPVLVDVDPETFNIDPSRIEAKITSATRAVIATHIFGVPCAIDKITEIASKHGLRVIEDCAHAMGALYHGRKVGSFGDAAFFSLETIKLLNTFGGGVIVTDDENIASKARAAAEGYPRNDNAVRKKILIAFIESALVRGPVFTLLMKLFVSRETALTRFYWSFRAKTRIGHSRYSPVQARMGLKQMEMFDIRNEERARAAGELEKALPALVSAQKTPENAKRVQYFFVVRLSTSRPIEDVRRDMLKMGVDCGVREEITDNCSLIAGNWADYPVAAELYATNLQLPMYDNLRDKDIKQVARSLAKAIE